MRQELTQGFRFPLIHARHGDGATVYPAVQGEVEVQGRLVGPVQFLVDTGADVTLVNGQAIMDQVHRIYPLGETDSGTTGVGGGWPCSKFADASLRLQTEGDEDIQLALPSLFVQAPYRMTVLKRDGSINVKGRLNHEPNVRQVPGFPTTGRRKTRAGEEELWEASNVPNLLGRDAIEAAGGALWYDPGDTSSLQFPISSD